MALLGESGLCRSLLFGGDLEQDWPTNVDAKNATVKDLSVQVTASTLIAPNEPPPLPCWIEPYTSFVVSDSNALATVHSLLLKIHVDHELHGSHTVSCY